jgi:hypothetical protein
MSPSSVSWQSWLALGALAALTLFGALLVFQSVPAANQTIFATIVGALAGALTVAGGGKLADKITNASGDNPTIQPDAKS